MSKTTNLFTLSRVAEGDYVAIKHALRDRQSPHYGKLDLYNEPPRRRASDPCTIMLDGVMNYDELTMMLLQVCDYPGSILITENRG